jgi:hypothetical protein
LGKKERRLFGYPRPERIIRPVWHTPRRSDTYTERNAHTHAISNFNAISISYPYFYSLDHSDCHFHGDS